LAEEGPQSLYQQNLSGSVAIVVGSEDQGLRQLTRKHCDYLVHIPMVGRTPSLNVSVATAVVLYECLRQRTSSDASITS
jgi:23S rRNA (guanosine2251-2'-O)-methyltransferase